MTNRPESPVRQPVILQNPGSWQFAADFTPVLNNDLLLGTGTDGKYGFHLPEIPRGSQSFFLEDLAAHWQYFQDYYRPQLERFFSGTDTGFSLQSAPVRYDAGSGIMTAGVRPESLLGQLQSMRDIFKSGDFFAALTHEYDHNWSAQRAVPLLAPYLAEISGFIRHINRQTAASVAPDRLLLTAWRTQISYLLEPVARTYLEAVNRRQQINSAEMPADYLFVQPGNPADNKIVVAAGLPAAALEETLARLERDFREEPAAASRTSPEQVLFFLKKIPFLADSALGISPEMVLADYRNVLLMKLWWAVPGFQTVGSSRQLNGPAELRIGMRPLYLAAVAGVGGEPVLYPPQETLEAFVHLTAAVTPGQFDRRREQFDSLLAQDGARLEDWPVIGREKNPYRLVLASLAFYAQMLREELITKPDKTRLLVTRLLETHYGVYVNGWQLTAEYPEPPGSHKKTGKTRLGSIPLISPDAFFGVYTPKQLERDLTGLLSGNLQDFRVVYPAALRAAARYPYSTTELSRLYGQVKNYCKKINDPLWGTTFWNVFSILLADARAQ